MTAQSRFCPRRTAARCSSVSAAAPFVVFQPQPHRSGCTDDAPDKIPKGWPGCGECILSIARLKDPDDKYLQLFTRDEQGGDPVNISVRAPLWLDASSLG